VSEHGAVFRTEELALALHVVREPEDEHIAQVSVQDEDVHATVGLVAGQRRGVLLASAADGPPREIGVAEIRRLLDQTVGSWRSWLAGSTYTGRWRESVQRSAITLELMTCAPIGGLVAGRPPPCPSRSAASATGTTATRGSAMPRSRCTPGLFVMGVGVGIMLTASVDLVQSAWPEKVQGDISGVSRSASNLGSSPGVAIAGSLIAGASASFGEPFALAIVVLGIFAMVGWVAALLIPRSAPREAGAEGAPA
jgi:hypothetical protein